MNEDSVSFIYFDHGGEYLLELVGASLLDVLLDIRVLVDDLAIFIEHSKTLELLAVTLELKCVVELVAEQVGLVCGTDRADTSYALGYQTRRKTLISLKWGKR